MASFRRWFLTALAVSSSTSNVFGALVQKQGLQLPANASTYRDAAQKLFTNSYQAYKDYAWGHDDLAPMSKGFVDSRNGWGASIADAMGTMYIMGLTDWFEEAVNHTASTDFTKTNNTVNLFETTIRYIAGFVSAYELSDQKYPVLIQKAQELADHMAYAWVGNNPIPYNVIDFSKNASVPGSTGIAAAGSLTLEWNLLSKYTNNDTYRVLGEKPVQHIMNLPNPPLPGLPGQGLDSSSGQSTNKYVTWGGGSDSYFEYLIKYPRLTNTDDNSYTDAWLTAVDSSVRELLKTSTVGSHLYLADYDDDKKIRHVGSHLACFYGGNWILGGKMTNNDTLVNYGLQLTDACWNTYASTVTGIGPEYFAFESSDGTYTGGSAPDANATAFYNKHGFYITGGDYILRPEVLESNFYAWRATGDMKYLNNAASAIKSFQDYLTATVAYTGIADVNAKGSDKYDDMESFWFAEVLKYLYLTFDDPNHISLDEYVFNTECHPFKAPAAKAMYGST
ncbi:glycoside hydrolase family 47 protein [Hygrophoropsis aurantiaca]|uniref:Glycoside hydrolase family 47 protein n=1 Tax=Hygrophoropsis aurantiaca TaxID=72124 RepID=A0ACB8AV78_9AGAM|nr:glycoside hydrolase family 47 protein [Hygrophoropsis aurantiaca]